MKKLLLFIFILFNLNDSFSQHSITICEENQTSFIYSTGTNQVGTYYWYIDGLEETTNSSSILINWQQYDFGIHTIQVEFESQFGCNSEPILYTVTTSECNNSTLYAPNTFTPDGDNFNNTWLPTGYKWKEIYYIIFNRWGEIIFESYDGNVGWDGTYSGILCQQGVYVYKLIWVDNYDRKNTKYGHINLIK